MNIEWNIFAVQPPSSKDFFVKLMDNTIAVARKDVYGHVNPANVEGCEDCDSLDFDSKPMKWAEIPEEFYK
jgi:hypothetical protein